MLSLLGILPILQALSCIFTIYGVAHATQTADVVVKYGVGADGPTAMEWMNSFGSIVVGVGGFAITHFMKQKQTSELVLAVWGELKSPKDPSSIRRLAFALLDWFEVKIAERYSSNPQMLQWWSETFATIRTEFAKSSTIITPPTNPPA